MTAPPLPQDRTAVLDRLFDVQGLGASSPAPPAASAWRSPRCSPAAAPPSRLADADAEGVERATAALARGAPPSATAPSSTSRTPTRWTRCPRRVRAAGRAERIVFANAESLPAGPTTPEGRSPPSSAPAGPGDRHQPERGLRHPAGRRPLRDHRRSRPGHRWGRTASVAGLGGTRWSGTPTRRARPGSSPWSSRRRRPGRSGILVNAIAPGSFRTNIARGPESGPRPAEQFAKTTVVGRLADPTSCRAWPCSWPRPRRATSPGQRLRDRRRGDGDAPAAPGGGIR